MVEISRASARYHEASSKKKKPLWLFAAYGLFLISCWNAFRTYQKQKELVRLKLETERENSASIEIHSAGAEEHVVTAGVGSSQYGGSVKARDKSSNKKRKKLLEANFKGIRPEPSDGSNDYTTNHPPSEFRGFGFTVMADTPYTVADAESLESQLSVLRNYTENNPDNNLVFALHLGGTQTSSQCNESAYEKHANTIAQWPRPTFVTPGKSDWFDCPDKDEAFGFFVKHLGPDLSSKWGNNQTAPLGIERSQKNPELFRFLYEGILVIGLHVIDPQGEFASSRNKRMETSMRWLAETVEEKFVQHEIRGVVIVGHAGKSEANNRFFAHAKSYFVGRKETVVLYLHGNGREWNLDKNSSPFYFVGVEQRGLTEPVIIDVAAQRNGKHTGLRERNEMQKIVGKGLFRLDRKLGQPPEERQ